MRPVSPWPRRDQRSRLLEQCRYRRRQHLVLGPTFDNAARRMASYAERQGKNRIMIVHERNTASGLASARSNAGVSASGGTVVAVSSYEYSQQGVSSAAPGIVRPA